jgi:hypothetical protein
MSALSLARSVRGHGFQMHHYRGCAGDPLISWRFEPLSFAYFALRRRNYSAAGRGETTNPAKLKASASISERFCLRKVAR